MFCSLHLATFIRNPAEAIVRAMDARRRAVELHFGTVHRGWKGTTTLSSLVQAIHLDTTFFSGLSRNDRAL